MCKINIILLSIHEKILLKGSCSQNITCSLHIAFLNVFKYCICFHVFAQNINTCIFLLAFRNTYKMYPPTNHAFMFIILLCKCIEIVHQLSLLYKTSMLKYVRCSIDRNHYVNRTLLNS